MKRKMKIVKHREKSFPDNLEDRLNAILNVINIEFKTLTMLHLDDIPADGSEIKARIKETAGEVCLPQGVVFGRYCYLTLSPMGMVLEENKGYRITKAGKKYCLPIAAFSLEYAVKNKISMFSILGNTCSWGKSRAPSNRVKILEALKKRNLRIVDLENELDLDSTDVCKHLKALKEIGFVNYESCGVLKKGIFVYEWTDRKNIEKIEPVSRWATLTEKVARKMKELRIGSSPIISEALNYQYSASDISHTLVGLEKQGAVKRVSRWISQKLLSEAYLLDRGKRFLDDHIKKLKDALSKDSSLKKMSSLYEQLINERERYRENSRIAIDLYSKVSPYMKKK